jgi:hypothetical protein
MADPRDPYRQMTARRLLWAIAAGIAAVWIAALLVFRL